MIQRTVVAEPVNRSHSPEPFVGCAKYEARHSCIYESSCAHDTRFNGRINREPSQPIIARLLSRRSECQNLCVRRRIASRDRRISRDRNHLALIINGTGSDGDFSLCSRSPGSLKRQLHHFLVRICHQKRAWRVQRTNRKYRFRAFGCQVCGLFAFCSLGILYRDRQTFVHKCIIKIVIAVLAIFSS